MPTKALKERPDPALELTGRLWEAHKDYEKAHQIRLSQSKLAEMLGEATGVPVDQTTVSTWFKGTPPKPWYLEGLAAIYGVDLMWLSFGKGSPKPNGRKILTEEPESVLLPRQSQQKKRRA